MTQEFHISITPVRADEYLVRTEEVSPGVPLAEEQFVWPTLEWLKQARQLMNDPIVGLLQGDRLTPPGASPNQTESDANVRDGAISDLMALGQQFYSSLFQGRLRDSWMTAQGIAQHRGEALRLRLGLKGSHVPCLPWEVLNRGANDGFHSATRHIATGVDILFSRYLADAGMGGALAPQVMPKPRQTLKILMAIAAPTDQQQLKLKQEAHHLQEELRLKANVLQSGIANRLPDIRVTILEQPGREELAQALEQGHYNVFHFAGHSDLGGAGGQIYLVNRQTGLSESLSGNDLAGLLLNNKIHLAVFNSCRGAHTAASSARDSQDDTTLTDALVNRGIPAVLAMAEQIPDDVALSLTRLFYRNLKQDYPVDLSLSRARQGLLSAYSSEQLYWALPILYMHPDFDGYLIEGDRSLDNPADSLIRLPHLYSSPLTEVVSAMSSGSVRTDDDAPPPADLDAKQADDRISGVGRYSEPHDPAIETPAQPHGADPVGAVQIGSAIQASEFNEKPQECLDDEDIEPEDLGPQDNVAAVGSAVFELGQDNLGQDNLDHDNTDIHLESLEPQDAPILDEEPDLPDDFFLGDQDLDSLDSGLHVEDAPDSVDASAHVRNLIEQLEDVETENGAIASTHDDDTIANEITLDLSSDSSSGNGTASQHIDSEADLHEGGRDSAGDKDPVEELFEQLGGAPIEEDVTPFEESKSSMAMVQSTQGLSKAPDASSVDAALLKRRRSSSWRNALWLPIASVAGAAIVFLGYRLVPEIQEPGEPGSVVVVPENVTHTDLPDTSTRLVSEFGMASFANDHSEDGQAAIQELLNRGELEEAAAVLDSVPTDEVSSPDISFLQGRLAWQDVHDGEATFSIQDASQFWTYAAQKSDEPLYYNALGFALYSEGRTEEALDAWKSALIALDESGISIIPGDSSQNLSSQDNQLKVDVPQRPLSQQDALTAYAGIALAMTQLSASTSVEQPYDLLSQAVQIRQVVLQSPSGLNPNDSEHHWLWTDALTQEWEIFKGVHSQ